MAPWLFRCSKTPSATMRMVRHLAIVGIACLVTACAHRPPITTLEDIRAEARVAFLAQDYARTLSLVEPQALTGAPWAQYTLGYMYYYGRGLALDRARARGWIQLAADQGYAPAQAALKRLHNPAPAGSDALINSASPSSTSASHGTQAPAPNTPPGAMDNPQSVPETSGTTSSAVNSLAPGASAPEHAAPTGTTTPPPPAPPVDSIAPTSVPPVTDQSSLTQNTALPPRAPSSPTPPSGTDEVKSDSWVIAQEAQRYTLQLIGSSDRDAVIRYIRDRNISTNAAYYTTTRDDRPWYVVVYGNYADRATAQAALLNLPPNVHVTSPWIRQFGDIKTHLTAP